MTVTHLKGLGGRSSAGQMRKLEIPIKTMTQDPKLKSIFDSVTRRHGYVAGIAAFVGALTDFLSPIGGWYVSTAIAAICALLFLLVLLRKKWLSDFIEGSELLRRWVGGALPCDVSCVKAPAAHYLAIATLVFGYTSYITKAHADVGGALASNFDQVKAYQAMMGIMASVQTDVVAIRKDTGEIKEALKGLDKETSDNPRKELAKRGIDWHPWDFFNAALAGDLEDVRLFRLAGMKKIGDMAAQCEMALPRLLLEYAGPQELRAVIWEEVLAAIGNDALNEECEIIGLFETALPDIHNKIQTALKHYKKNSVEIEPKRVSLLMLAIWMQDKEMVDLFLAHGAKVDRGLESFVLGYTEKIDGLKITPLSEANRLGLNEIAMLLKQHGGKDIASNVSPH